MYAELRVCENRSPPYPRVGCMGKAGGAGGVPGARPRPKRQGCTRTRHRSQPQRTGALLRVNCSLYALRSLYVYRYSFRIARGIFMSLKCGRAEYFIGILPKRKTRENMHMCICMCVGILFVRMANLNIKSLNESRGAIARLCAGTREPGRERERERERQTDRQRRVYGT